jgi:hypothetical protein
MTDIAIESLPAFSRPAAKLWAAIPIDARKIFLQMSGAGIAVTMSRSATSQVLLDRVACCNQEVSDRFQQLPATDRFRQADIRP